MTRSRDFSKILGRSVTNDTFTATGSITPLSVTSYNYDSAGQLQALNNSSLVDGSLHYLSKTKQLYVWDDSDNSYYPIDQGTSALEGPSGFSVQGSSFGYRHGGFSSPPSSYAQDILKFSFTSDGNATRVGDMAIARTRHSAVSSASSGYIVGGKVSATGQYGGDVTKFSFSSDGDAADVTDVASSVTFGAGGTMTEDTGYVTRGTTTSTLTFASDAGGSDLSNTTTSSRSNGAGSMSSTHSYYAGGGGGAPGSSNVIDKFPFASPSNNSADVGDIVTSRGKVAGHSSTTHGYISGGNTGGPGNISGRNQIDKFSFSSDGNATDVGDLTAARYDPEGTMSTASGYSSGGRNSLSYYNIIDKFPFASDGNSTDVGDLLHNAREDNSRHGNQV